MWFFFVCLQFGFKYLFWTADFLTVITNRIASGFNMRIMFIDVEDIYQFFCCIDFFIEEYRGIGGISFDDFCEGTIDECFGLLVSCAKAAVPAYIQIIHDNRYRAYTEKQREWQLVRRGR